MKKKETKADKLRKWHLPYPKFQWHHLRYKNPYQKGVLWFFTSLDIRTRDVEKYGTCISCGKPITVETCQAGHYAPAGNCGRDLLFHPLNLHAECPSCNAFDSGHLIGMRKNLVIRYGENGVLWVEEQYEIYRNSKAPVKDWKASEYEELIKQSSSYQKAVDKAKSKMV